MRIQLDYTRAKTMATRLQDFISENPQPKLTRSSSIEAVARILGFPNRNTMKAQLEKSQATSPEEAPNWAPEKNAAWHIDAALSQEITNCAEALVRTGREISPGSSFKDAMHSEGPEGDHVLLMVEDVLAAELDADPDRLRILHAGLFHSPEMESAKEVRHDIVSMCAHALINEAMTKAERLWSETQSSDPNGQAGEIHDTLELAIQKASKDLERAIRDGIEPGEHLMTLAGYLAREFSNPLDRAARDILSEFIADYGMTPEAYYEADQKKPWLTWDVDVSCWVPGSLLVELPGDRVADLEAEVLSMATIQVDASDEEDALTRAQEMLDNGASTMIWNPRPDRGVRNARWVSDTGKGDPDDFVSREEDLVEDHWQFDYDRAREFKADQVAG
jgi:hypothetical protein